MHWSMRRVHGGMLPGSLPTAARLEWTSPITSTQSNGNGSATHSCATSEMRDFIGGLIVQEIMLESFAVASYARVGKVAPGSLGKTLDAQRFDDKVYRLHLDVRTTLAELLRKDGHCEVCHDRCVKPSLPEVSLSAAALRGASLEQYLKTLDMLGLPGEVTLRWVTQLPV
jgi:fatty aldehyde decarbonylase